MRIWWIAALIVVLGGLGLTPATAATADAVLMSASINGQDVVGANQQHPIRLDPQEDAAVVITLTNNSAAPLDVSAVHLSGHVLGLSFFAFHTSVAVTVEPGATQTVSYALDVTGLDGQATGLINATVAVFDDAGATIADLSTVTDVRGSIVSVYGLFGLALAILTALSILDMALAIARGRLPMNRWRRGLRLLTPGIGIGLVLMFSLSVARIWAPTTERWLTVAAAFAVGFFILGYLTPTPTDAGEDYDDEDVLDDDESGDAATGSAPTSADTIRAPLTPRTVTDRHEHRGPR